MENIPAHKDPFQFREILQFTHSITIEGDREEWQG